MLAFLTYAVMVKMGLYTLNNSTPCLSSSEMKLEWSSDLGFHWSFAYLLWWSTTLPAQKNMKHHYNYSQTSGKRPPKNAKTDQWSQNT